SRLSNTRLAREQRYLTFACFCFRPASKQQIEFFLPSDKLSQPARVESLEAAFHRSLSQCGPSSHRPRDALEAPCSKVLKLEKIANKLPSALRNDHAVR